MKKSSILDMQKIALKQGGTCLSKRYVNWSSKLKWKCGNNHKPWYATPRNIYQGAWCPECARSKNKLTINELQLIAESKSGLCLTEKYINSKEKMEWKCKAGHHWYAPAYSIKCGSWCPTCSGQTLKNISEMRLIAKSKGGKCLSKEYKNTNSKLEWMCEKRHVWSMSYGSIKRGAWCPICNMQKRMKYSLADAQQIAKKNDGVCLSDIFKNSDSKLKWLCNKGHKWEASLYSVLSRGSWCKICRYKITNKKRMDTIEMMNRIANERGGKCLSKKYQHSNSKLLWECGHGHQWIAIPASIKSGRWCPECRSNSREQICRAYFEGHFGKKFSKQRPAWLKYKNVLLELDGYNKELKIAFEYNGEQHYRIVETFTPDVDSLKKRKILDRYKKMMCKKMGIALIIIPYTVKEENVQSFIIRKCEKLGLQIKNSEYQLSNADKFNIRNKLIEAHEYAEKREGRCLSTIYFSTRKKLKWECKKGHIWEASYDSINKGSWCPQCSHNKKKNISDMQIIAKERNGICHSKKYISNQQKLKWECKKGHIWEASYDSIRKGSWCPSCVNHPEYDINDMKKWAKARYGKCLSSKYLGCSAKLLWQCKNGHQWMATPTQIRKGYWCADCIGRRRFLRIEDMKAIAKNNNGKCISDEYLGYDKKLSWQCEKGHRWKMSPDLIKQGAWCPACVGKKSKKKIK